MEIIHVVLGKANPDRMNGVNKVVHQLATQQSLAGHHVTLWGITKDISHNYPARNFDTRLFKSYKNKFRLDPKLPAAVRNARGKKIIYHLHGGFNPEMFRVAKTLASGNQKFVFTPHGAYNTIAMRKRRLAKKIYFRLFEETMLKKASRIHSLGASEVAGLQQVFPNEKSALIPYGFAHSAQARNAATTGEFIIGYCGRIDIYTKGLDVLVQAFTLLIKKYPHAKLWIIGGGGEEEKLNQLTASISNSNVKLWGALFGEEKEKVMRQFSLFVHPSRNEGLPTAVLEAAAMGIPCVVTTATNTADVIDLYKAGETIHLADPVKLYEALSGLAEKQKTKEFEAISANAREMVKQEFNWNNIVRRFEKLYQSCFQ